MRTTFEIDDDVLAAAKAIARQQKRTMGEVLSELARIGLRKPGRIGSRGGVPLLPPRNPQVRITLEMINALHDETP